MAAGWKVNITPAERIARVVVGVAATLTGGVLLGSATCRRR